MRNIFIATHSNENMGPIDGFEDYLLKNHKEFNIYKLSNPLDNYYSLNTIFLKNKKVINTIKRFNLGIINFFIDFLITFFYASKNNPQYLYFVNHSLAKS